MAGNVKLMTSAGGGVILDTATTTATDVTVKVPVTGVNGGTLVCSDSSGNVGIGTSSPTDSSSFGRALDISSSTGAGVYLRDSSSSTDYGLIGYYGESTHSLYLQARDSSGYIQFQTGGTTERMRIDSSGNLLVGGTSLTGANSRLTVKGNTSWSIGPQAAGDTFYVYNASATGVYLTTGATSWSASSDERAKDIIEPISDAAAKVSTLRAVIGKYKTDEEGTRRSFLIAQDVQKVLPEAVNVQEGEEGYLGLQYADTIPLLVAAIKELSAKNDALEARIAALEAK